MGRGRPTIDVDAGAIERAVEEDPWVSDASVSVVWPGTVFIDVIEHTPLVAVASGGSWLMMSVDGAALEQTAAPTPTDAAIAIDVAPLAIGDTTGDRDVLGALAFIEALPEDLGVGMVVTVGDGGLQATVQGHAVRLGRPVDMAMKATVLEGLIAAGIEDGSDINLIAPSRPAVSQPSTSG